MSVRAMNWAFDVIGFADLTSTDRLVLLALAHRHSAKGGRCDPSVETLCEMTGLKVRAVQYALRTLETMKLIKAKPRTVAGKQITSQYDLRLGVHACAPLRPQRGVHHKAPPLGVHAGAPNRERDIPKGGKSGEVSSRARILKLVGGAS